MDAKVTREYELKNGALDKSAQEDIQEFISIFNPDFKVNYDMEIVMTVKIKHDEDGTQLMIKFKDSNVEDVNPNQLSLFKKQEEEAEV